MTAISSIEPGVAASHAGPRSLSRLLDAVMLIGSDLDLQAMLRRIVEAAVDLVDARYGALGVLDDSGTRLAEFITVGIDDESRAVIGELPKGLGLLGSLITDARPRRLAQIGEDPDSSGFPPHHPPMTSFLGVPVRVRGTVFGNLYLTDKTTGEVFTDIDEELATGLAAAAGVGIENARLYDHGRRREAALAAMTEVATALVAGADRHNSLQLVARHARRLLGGDLATIATPLPDSEDLVLEVVDGDDASELWGRSFPRSGTIAGDVLRTAKSVAVEDCALDSRVHPDHLRGAPVGPAVFVALVADSAPFGTLTVARARRAPVFDPDDVALAESFAAQASVILDGDRGRHDVERRKLVEGQERFGRDLHDAVIQDIHATGLALQSAMALIDDPAAREHVEDAVDRLDRTIARIRTVIFDIEVSAAEVRPRLRDDIVGLLRDSGALLGFEPALRFAGNIDTLPAGLAADALATLREALSNVARHAGAGRVDVDVRAEDVLTVGITDDGVGLRADRDRTLDGHGLADMHARAERHGGTVWASSRAGGGTEVVWSVPLPAGTGGPADPPALRR